MNNSLLLLQYPHNRQQEAAEVLWTCLKVWYHCGWHSTKWFDFRIRTNLKIDVLFFSSADPDLHVSSRGILAPGYLLIWHSLILTLGTEKRSVSRQEAFVTLILRLYPKKPKAKSSRNQNTFFIWKNDLGLKEIYIAIEPDCWSRQCDLYSCVVRCQNILAILQLINPNHSKEII